MLHIVIIHIPFSLGTMHQALSPPFCEVQTTPYMYIQLIRLGAKMAGNTILSMKYNRNDQSSLELCHSVRRVIMHYICENQRSSPLRLSTIIQNVRSENRVSSRSLRIRQILFYHPFVSRTILSPHKRIALKCQTLTKFF